MCECNCAETTYVEVCEEEYICNTVTTWVQLGSDSYCDNSCNDDGNYCTWYWDCWHDNGLESESWCNNNAQCITHETQYICGDEYVCVDGTITECP